MLLIKNCTIFKDGKKQKVNVQIEDGKISQISSNDIPLNNNQNVTDAKGLYLLPGIIDLNVRVLNNMLNKKNLNSLFESAKKGGVTTFVLMPDFSPSITNETILELLNTKLKKRERQNLIVSIEALADQDKNQLNNISSLLKNGAKVVKQESSINGNLVRRVMQYAKMKKIPLFCFCNNPSLSYEGVMNEGEVSFKLGLPEIPKISEISEVAKVVQMAEYYQVKTLFQTLSTKKSIDILQESKKNFKNLFCEISIHHLILNDTLCDNFNTYAKLNPPLRDENERLMLLKAMQEGCIDTITSSHSPKSVLYKDIAFEDASFGIDAMENFLSLCFTFLVQKNIIDIEKLFKMISEVPADILDLGKVGKVEEGYMADLILFDPEHKEMVKDEKSLYHGETLSGKVIKNILRGRML